MSIGLTVAGDEVCVIDEIRHLDRRIAKAQVRNRNATGFFRVISKVCLSVHIGVVADDLDSALIRTDRTVGTEAPELTSFQAFTSRIDVLDTRQGFMRNVIDDTQGEVVLRFEGFQVVKSSYDVAR